MNGVNKTLYIPLYGKALVSGRGIILNDKKAEEIWSKEQFPLKRKARSKHLAFYMAMRARVFDAWLEEKLMENQNSLVLHLGCGLDSRVFRVKNEAEWYDVDFESVINERRKYFSETEHYHMISADITNTGFIKNLPISDTCLVVLEGVSMYIEPSKLAFLLGELSHRYSKMRVLADFYTDFGAKMSKIKNPIKTVGARRVYGMTSFFESGTGLRVVREHEMTPRYLINQLSGMDKKVFSLLYAGKISKKIYKLYELEGNS